MVIVNRRDAQRDQKAQETAGVTRIPCGGVERDIPNVVVDNGCGDKKYRCNEQDVSDYLKSHKGVIPTRPYNQTPVTAVIDASGKVNCPALSEGTCTRPPNRKLRGPCSYAGR